ncbi:hypothetical protein KCH_54800 [Kitasatospora cheerisanensis KCTC 2395]|uniref:Uncharacterized protein n=1 Tax=Kitasatospora cheerisanensis KCTC 2395 TaxID=1348663 RepID=A0A066YXW4_9ACTN|nr:hypothetical protein KCH_54800 [Kitasatospora cheerisanensis KCTC 2395]
MEHVRSLRATTCRWQPAPCKAAPPVAPLHVCGPDASY